MAQCRREQGHESVPRNRETKAQGGGSPTPGSPTALDGGGAPPWLTSLPHLDGAQGQHILLIRQELLHLDEGLLAFHRELTPRLGPGQDLAHRALRQSQDVMSEDALANVVLDELLFDLPGDLCGINFLAL